MFDRALPRYVTMSLVLATTLMATTSLAKSAKKKAKKPKPIVTAMTFSSSGKKLLVGYSDGKLARFDIKKKRGKLKTIDREKNPIAAISPDGKSAVLDASPVAIVETRRGKHLAEISKFERLEDAVYSADGELLLISGPDRLLIWKDAHKLDALAKKGVRLEEYAARQDGDKSVSMGEMRAQMDLTDDAEPSLLFGDSKGLLTLWTMANASEAKFIAKLPPPHSVRVIHRDIALIASASDRVLHVFDHKKGKALTWNETLHADLAISTSLGPVLVDDKTISLRDVETGEVVWSVEEDFEAAEEFCGIAKVEEKKRARVAVCHDQAISIYDVDKGKRLVRFTRSGSKLKRVRAKKKS